MKTANIIVIALPATVTLIKRLNDHLSYLQVVTACSEKISGGALLNDRHGYRNKCDNVAPQNIKNAGHISQVSLNLLEMSGRSFEVGGYLH